MKEEAGINDFIKLDIRIGTIVEVFDFPEARKPAYKLHINFGEKIGIRKSSAQITTRYTKETLLGKQVTAVINFPKRQIANFMSDCLVLGAVENQDVILLRPDSPVPNGLKIA